MKSDVHGCSTCPAGAEQYETYYSALAGGMRVQYDYRTPDGRLFACIAKTIDEARARRDAWLRPPVEVG